MNAMAFPERKKKMPDAMVTITGNLVADPEVRFTANGVAVANLTIASTPRTYDRQSSEWKDGETLFLRGAVWKEAAENVADNLTKGQRVIAIGKLKQRSFEDKEGNKRSSIELEIDEIGPSLRFAAKKKADSWTLTPTTVNDYSPF
jgi:single-strand DNA-binding protein